jgi:rhodanese-related sulfurtransferase
MVTATETAVDVAEADRLRRAGALVVDVRGGEEWARGHIPGALHLPLDELTDRRAELPPERDLLVLCQRGFRSAGAAGRLRQAGFTAVNVKGGLNAWIARGLPMEGSGAGGSAQGFGARSLALLDMQGFSDLSVQERRAISFGLRLTTGACMTTILIGLWLGSPILYFVLAGIAAVGALTPRHPFDFVWQWGVRHLVGGSTLPPNPRERRLPFAMAAPWLLSIGLSFAAGLDLLAYALGVAMAVSCAIVTFTHLCLPGAMLAVLARRRRASATAGEQRV